MDLGKIIFCDTRFSCGCLQFIGGIAVERYYWGALSAAVGCAYVTLTNVQNISPGAAGIIGFVCIKSGGMLNYMIGILISLVVGFAVTMVLSKHPKFKEV